LPAQTQQGDALADLYRRVSDEIDRQRQISEDRGLWADGAPTPAGSRDAAMQLGQGLVLGSTAPRAPGRTVADIGGGQRGMMAVPSLRSMAPVDAEAVAATEPHIIDKPGGGYIGAPADVRTPEDIQAMRDRLDTSIDQGAHGRDWYGRVRDWITDITGNQGVRPTAEGIGVFSPQSDPNTNLQFYLQARNAWERGLPIDKAKTTAQAATYNQGMAASEAATAAGETPPDFRLGKKTAPFAWHMSPDRPYGTTGVNDIWHARSFGYKNPDGSEFDGSPTEQQHMFMDYETVLAVKRANERASGGYTDWDAASVQAAPWVANKEASLRQRFPNWSDDRVRQTALATYPDYAVGTTAYMPHEQVPGQSTGLLDLLPENQRQAFSEASTWAHPETGRDILTGDMFHQSPVLPGTGTYTNSAGQLEMNPVQTARPLVDFTANVEPREVAPGTQSALTGASAVRGYVDMQEGTPWHFIDTRGAQRTADTNSMRLTGQRPTVDQMARLQEIADRHGYYVADTGDGVSMINAGNSVSPADGIQQKARLKAGLQAEIDQALPGATITPGRASSDYVDLASQLAESVKGQGQATSAVLDQLQDMKAQAPRMYERMLDNPGIAAKAQANLDRLTPEMRTARPDYVQALQIISGGNLRGLLERVAKVGAAGLPAALATLSATTDQRN
jgi:hypothetical protein